MTTLGKRFEINGVISTDKSVMQNLNALCSAAGCWATYDIAEGRWSVVINRSGSSVASFNDSNIIGGINVSGTGINELYNSATIEFPHKDLRDQTDYIDLEVPAGDMLPNELPNRLNISTDLMNDPIQAQYIANVELKQNRLDKIIQFRTDYSKIGLKAGDLIDVTNEAYGYNAKVFRITRVEENDDDVLSLSITALEYSEDLYSTDGLIRKIREKKTGIVPKAENSALTESDAQALSGAVSFAFQAVASTGTVEAAYRAHAGLTPFGGTVQQDGQRKFAGDNTSFVEITFTLSRSFKSVTFFCQTPAGLYDFFRSVGPGPTLELVQSYYSFIPTEFTVYRNGVELAQNTADWQTQNCTFPLYNLSAGTYSIRIIPLATNDLNQIGITGMAPKGQTLIFPGNYTIAPQTSGGGFTVTGLAIV